MREAEVIRETKETKINLEIIIDAPNPSYNIKTSIGFLNHMLELFAKHGNFSINLNAIGDVEVDYHHTIEDIGIVLGEGFRKALSDFKGIKRYGSRVIPMDDSLSMVTIDISNRPYLVYNTNLEKGKVGEVDIELFEEFFTAFANNLRCNLHINNFYGKNNHHILESIFKAFAYSMREAVTIIGDEVISTKGILI